MFPVSQPVTDTAGNVQKGWSVDCYAVGGDPATAAAVTIYSDYAGSTAIPGGRVAADAYGMVYFFIPSGSYGMRFYDTTGVMRRFVPQLDMYGADNATAAAASAATASAASATAVASAATATGAATTATGAATTATTQASNASTANTSAQSAAAQALQAATQSQGFANTLNTNATALPYEVTAITLGTAGSGATVSGEFALTVSGGPAGHMANVVVSGGAITGARILNPGIATTNTAPTYTLPTITGLTGATAPTATVGTIPVNRVFTAPSADGSQLLAWINNAGSLSQFPTSGTQFAQYFKAGVDAAVAPALSLGTGTAGESGTIAVRTNTLVTTNTWIHATPATISGNLRSVTVAVSAACIATIVVATISGSNATRTAMQQVFLNAGLSTVEVNLPITAGQYFGIYGALLYRNNTGTQTTVYSCTTAQLLPTTSTAITTNANQGAQIAGVIYASNTDAITTGQTARTVSGYSEIVGPTTITTGTGVNSNLAIAMFQAQTLSRAWDTLDIDVWYNGTNDTTRASLVIANPTYDANNNITALDGLATIPISRLEPGGNYLTGIRVPSGIDTTGKVVGIYSPDAGIKRDSAAGRTMVYTTGIPTTATAVTVSGGYGLQLRIRGTNGNTSKAENTDKRLGGLIDYFGADNTGISNSDSAFAKARTSLPQVYVPAGVYTLTSMPADGDGFWGPGRCYVNGILWPLPHAPMSGGLYKRARSQLARQIMDGSALVIVSDSTGQGTSGTSDWTKSWAYLMCKALNAVSSPYDEPVMTQFSTAASGGVAFGVTLPATPTIGTNGPVNQSLILQVGQSISFTGTYAFVDVFYQQTTTAGTLNFSVDGGATTYRSVVCAGAAQSDKCSFDNVTGTGFPATSKTYTITATGAAVEITGIVRLGDMTTSSGREQRRIPVVNAARDSQTFPFATLARLQSAYRMATALGQTGTAAANPAIWSGYGTNDAKTDQVSFGTLYTRAQQLITDATTAGFKTFYGATIARVTSAASYAGGANTFEGSVGALRAAYKDKGVPVFPLDSIDWINRGLFFDGVHRNIAGHEVEARAVLEWLGSLS